MYINLKFVFTWGNKVSRRKREAQWKQVFRTRHRRQDIEGKRRRERKAKAEDRIDVRSGYATFHEFESGGVGPAGNSYLAHILKLETSTIYGTVRTGNGSV